MVGWPEVRVGVEEAATGAECCCRMPGNRWCARSMAGQSGVLSSVLMSPFLLCVLPVTPFRMNESRWSEWAPFIPVACCPVCSAIGWLAELVGVAHWM